MIDGKNIFAQQVKNAKVTYENIRKIATGPGDDYKWLFVRLFLL